MSLVLPVDNCASLYLEHRIENSRTIPAEGITYREFLRKTRIRTVDLLKIDIEGAEIDLFNSISDTELLNHKQITVEFHDFMFSGLKDKFSQLETRISNAGFYRVQFTLGSMDVLFIRKDLISYAGYLYLQFCVRYYLRLKILGQRISRKIERKVYKRTIR